MKHGKILESWVNYVCDEWLDIPNGGQLPTFHSSVEPLIAKLRKKVTEKDFVAAWHCIQQIERLYEHIPHEGRISPRMLLECGIAAFRMGNASEAIPFIKRAGTSYTQDHDKAMARWLLGCVYWYIDDSINALSCWEDARRHLNEQKTKSGQGAKLAQWYVDTIEDMDRKIQAASDDESPPVPVRFLNKKTIAEQHILQSLPVIGQIPAGTPLDMLPSPADSMKINRVYINEKEHCIISLLSGKKIVNIPQRERFHYLLRVSGNSMNQSSPEPIEDGDYVVLREQHIANSGDIVAAIIVKGQGEDERLATLKRYAIQGGRIFLKPESDDPQFQKPVYARSFVSLNDEFQIRGVAIGVLKPL